MNCCCFFYFLLLHLFPECIDVRILAGGSPHLLKMNCGHWSKVRGNKCMVKCKGIVYNIHPECMVKLNCGHLSKVRGNIKM